MLNAISVLQVLADIRDAAEGIQGNDQQARRLSERVKAIKPGVVAVKNGRRNVSSEALSQLLNALEEIRSFLRGYAQSSFLSRVWKRRSNAATFMDFSYSLSEGMQALHLDVLVDVWANQDASDRLEDIGNFKAAMRIEERHSTDNRAEFSRALTVSMKVGPVLRCGSFQPALLRSPSIVLPPVCVAPFNDLSCFARTLLWNVGLFGP